MIQSKSTGIEFLSLSLQNKNSISCKNENAYNILTEYNVIQLEYEIHGSKKQLIDQAGTSLMNSFFTCSKVKNIITFHDPSRPKFGMNPL